MFNTNIESMKEYIEIEGKIKYLVEKLEGLDDNFLKKKGFNILFSKSVANLNKLYNSNIVHNHKYRENTMEEIRLEYLKKNKDNNIHGMDGIVIENAEYKTQQKKPNKKNIYNIKNNTNIGTIGRIDQLKDENFIYTNSSLYCGLFTEYDTYPFMILYLSKEDTKEYFINEVLPQGKKLHKFKKTTPSTKRDSFSICIKDLIKYKSFKIIYMNNKYNISLSTELTKIKCNKMLN